MSYVAEHTDALADLRDAGAAITFTKPDVAATYDSASDTPASPAAPVAISGFAIQTKGKPSTYAQLSLVQSQAPTLFFAPTNIGELPEPGATCVWGGKNWSVVDVDPLAIDGSAIAAHIVIQR